MTMRTQPRGRARLVRATLAVGAMISLCGVASADEASDARAGQDLAVKACSPCHVVSERIGPPFADIAKGPHATPDALRDFLRSTHSDIAHPNAMPAPGLTERQIDELAAYIASLRGAK
jgi:mono/diheme cytochrome c family protein